MQTLAGAALIVAVSLGLAGCSFLFVSGPPKHVTAYTTLDCTTGRAAPGIDAALGVLSAIGTGVENDQGYRTEYIVAGLAWTAVYAASAIYGNIVVGSCQDAHEKHDALVEQEVLKGRRQQWMQQQPPPAPPGY